MKAYLMYRDRDFGVKEPPPPQEEALVQDLELPTLFAAMARGDKWLAEVVSKAVLASSADIGTVRHRQDILKDCLKREAVVREIYDLVVETGVAARKIYFWGGMNYPSTILYQSVGVLELLVGMLRRLRAIAEQHVTTFESEGFRRLFAMLAEELADDYFETIRRHLRQLQVPAWRPGQRAIGCGEQRRQLCPAQTKRAAGQLDKADGNSRAAFLLLSACPARR